MSEHQLITPRRNFLVRISGPALHMAELVKALKEIYPHVGFSGGTIDHAG
jgi:hypothetical protein